MINILFVEDNKDLSYSTIFALQQEGMQIDLAEDLASAYALFKKAQYDLMILDVMLPDGSGYDLCQKIRQSSQLPIIFLTACDTEPHVVMGLDLGGDDYVTKPFRIRELVSRIHAVLRRKGMQKERILVSGSIELIPEACKVRVNQTEVILTTTEYKLLLLFLNHPHQILTRTQILEKLWDVEGQFKDDNTLSVYIKRLRQKIKVEDGEYIETVRGMGYRWQQEVMKL